MNELEKLPGKTIQKVSEKKTWDDRLGGVVIHFTDGSFIELSAINGAGCYSCDPDGSLEATMFLWFKESEVK